MYLRSIKQIGTYIVIIIILVVISDLNADNSNIGAAFREKLVGARPLSMGGAYTALAADPLALIWNPAASHHQFSRHQLTIEHAQLLQFYEYSFIGYTTLINPAMSIGIGILHSGDEIMSESTCYLNFSTDLTFWDSFNDGKIFSIPGYISFGLTAKYHYSSFGSSGTDYFDLFDINHRVSGSASGIGLDAGIKLSLDDGKNHIGTSFKNLFSAINWDSENEAGTALGSYSEKIPLSWTTGYARTEEKWTGSIDINKALYNDVEDILHLGIEYNAVENLFLRGGYSQELVTADNKKLSAGIAVNIKPPGLPKSSLSFTYLLYNQWSENRSVLFSISLPAGSSRSR